MIRGVYEGIVVPNGHGSSETQYVELCTFRGTVSDQHASSGLKIGVFLWLFISVLLLN